MEFITLIVIMKIEYRRKLKLPAHLLLKMVWDTLKRMKSWEIKQISYF